MSTAAYLSMAHHGCSKPADRRSSACPKFLPAWTVPVSFYHVADTFAAVVSATSTTAEDLACLQHVLSNPSLDLDILLLITTLSANITTKYLPVSKAWISSKRALVTRSSKPANWRPHWLRKVVLFSFGQRVYIVNESIHGKASSRCWRKAFKPTTRPLSPLRIRCNSGSGWHAPYQSNT